MQTIYRNTYTTDFTVIKNDILNSELSGLAKAALIYLLSKPPHWRLRATDIKRFLKVGINKVYRILQELKTFGYIVMTRVQSAVHWFVYDAPQGKAETATGRARSDRDGFHHDGNGDDIVRTETPVKTENYNNPPTVQEPIPAPAMPNVVVERDLIDQQTPTACDPVPTVIDDKQRIACNPEPTPPTAMDDVQQAIAGIPDNHQPTARQALRSLTKAESDSVLCAFTLAMAKGGISNPVAYLITLVRATKNGTFSPVTGPQATPTMTAGERIAAEKRRAAEAAERGRMDNQQYFEWLSTQYGSKASASKPVQSTRVSMLRSAIMKTA